MELPGFRFDPATGRYFRLRPGERAVPAADAAAAAAAAAAPGNNHFDMDRQDHLLRAMHTARKASEPRRWRQHPREGHTRSSSNTNRSSSSSNSSSSRRHPRDRSKPGSRQQRSALAAPPSAPRPPPPSPSPSLQRLLRRRTTRICGHVQQSAVQRLLQTRILARNANKTLAAAAAPGPGLRQPSPPPAPLGFTHIALPEPCRAHALAHRIPDPTYSRTVGPLLELDPSGQRLLFSYESYGGGALDIFDLAAGSCFLADDDMQPLSAHGRLLSQTLPPPSSSPSAAGALPPSPQPTLRLATGACGLSSPAIPPSPITGARWHPTRFGLYAIACMGGAGVPGSCMVWHIPSACVLPAPDIGFVGDVRLRSGTAWCVDWDRSSAPPRLALGASGGVLVCSVDGSCHRTKFLSTKLDGKGGEAPPVFDLTWPSLPTPFHPRKSDILALRWDALGGEVVYAGGRGGLLHVLDLRSPRPGHAPQRTALGAVSWMDTLPNGSQLVAAGPDGAVELYDVRAQRTLSTLESADHHLFPNRCSLQPNSYLLARQTCGIVELYDLRRMELVRKLGAPIPAREHAYAQEFAARDYAFAHMPRRPEIAAAALHPHLGGPYAGFPGMLASTSMGLLAFPL